MAWELELIHHTLFFTNLTRPVAHLAISQLGGSLVRADRAHTPASVPTDGRGNFAAATGPARVGTFTAHATTGIGLRPGGERHLEISPNG